MEKKKEIWKDIDNFSRYKVSNFGNLISKTMKVKNKNGFRIRNEKKNKKNI